MEELTKNIGLYFYRGYYQDYFGTEGLAVKYKSNKEKQGKASAEKNKQFKKYKNLSGNEYIKINNLAICYPLKTTYPGLYTGSGYTFGAGVQGEFQLGSLFDHTTGLPYIPGSSVKGAIRAAFPNNDGGKLKRNTKYREQREDFLWNEIIEKVINRDSKLYKEVSNKESTIEQAISKIELELFEGRDFAKEYAERERLKKRDKKEEPKESYLGIYNRDVFHDAFISKTVQKGATKGQFLGLDYITPHKNPLKNPIPLPFLKILPGVEICFQFSFYDGYYLIAEEKKALAVEIIKTFGIGAKTNVGYGQFTDVI